uniref:Uncharacterized protein n=1 Tax=Uncultured archaeon GZfos26G2 TaxID=3386331 RepID=Q64CW5_UNCAG|nr:hypothetical protein GZ19C8_23 [uncultured archaeon GZfos19C8]
MIKLFYFLKSFVLQASEKLWGAAALTVNKVSSSKRREEVGETWRSVEICGKSLLRDKGR